MKNMHVRGWWIVMLAAALMIPSIGGTIVRREQELRVLLTARDMVQTGRWMEPHYRNQPRFQKPPLMYWWVGGFYALGAPMHSAAWGRLPSALCGIAYVWVLYALGQSVVGRRRAFAAALVAMMSLVVLRQSRLAETDMALTLFTTCSALAGARALQGGPGAWWGVAGLASALGFMVKGPAAVALPAAAWATYAWMRRGRVSSPARSPWAWAGLLAGVALVLPWYLHIAGLEQHTSRAQVQSEMSALLSESAHPGPFYYYVYTAPHAMLPWGLLLPWAVWAAWRAPRSRRGWTFPLAWLLSALVIMSLIRSKQLHYATLLTGPGALLIGCALHARGSGLRRWQPRLARFFPLLVVAAGCTLGVLLYLRVKPVPLPALILCALATIWAFYLFIRPLALPLLLPRYAVLMAALIPASVAYTAREGSKGSAARWMAQLTALTTPAETPVTCVGPLDACTAFYANRPASFAASLTEAWSNAAPGSVILATAREEQPTVATLPEPLALQRRNAGGWSGLWIKPAASGCDEHGHAMPRP